MQSASGEVDPLCVVLCQLIALALALALSRRLNGRGVVGPKEKAKQSAHTTVASRPSLSWWLANSTVFGKVGAHPFPPNLFPPLLRRDLGEETIGPHRSCSCDKLPSDTNLGSTDFLRQHLSGSVSIDLAKQIMYGRRGPCTQWPGLPRNEGSMPRALRRGRARGQLRGFVGSVCRCTAICLVRIGSSKIMAKSGRRRALRSLFSLLPGRE